MFGKKNRSAEAHSMTEGSPLRLLVLFSLPLMAGNLFQQLYTVVDTAIVGQALGVGALAALGTADWIDWLFISMVQGVTQGFSILVAQRFGARDAAGLRRAVGCTVTLTVVFGLVLSLLAQVLVGPLMALTRAPQEVRPIAGLYMRVLFVGIPVLTAYNLCAALLRAMGDSWTPLLAMVIASLGNIVLDLLFVIVFHWGVAGAAAATVLAEGLSVVWCIGRVRRMRELAFDRADARPDAAMTRTLSGLAAPMVLQNVVISVGGMIVQAVVNTNAVVFIAGFTATSKLYGLLEMAAVAFGYAMTTYTGQNTGAGDGGRVRAGLRAGIVFSLITSAVISLCMFLFGEYIVGLFIDQTDATGPEALAIGFRYLKVMATFLPILYILYTVRSAIQGMGNTFIPMVSGVAELVMRVGAALLLPVLFGTFGILYAEPAAWLGADIILIPGYFVTFRKVFGKTGR